MAYLGDFGGEVPYTAYNAKKSYIEKNEDVIECFSKAITKGLKFVKENDEQVIAKSISKYFPDTAYNDLVAIIKRYKEADAWKENININEKEWDHIQEIIISADQLEKKSPYKDLIYTKFFE